MGDIARITGQHAAVGELVGWASSSQPHVAPTAVVSGPSGCGKTWVAEQVADLLPDDITSVFARGDKSNAKRDYLPLTSVTMNVSRTSFAKTAMPELGRAMPAYGSIISFVLQYISNRRELGQTRKTFALDPTEREILMRLERLAGSGRLLLVLDDLQWWDDKSIALIQVMLSRRMNDVFPFLNATAYLALTTTGQTPVSASYAALRQSFEGPTIGLAYCEESDYGAVLVGLGLRTALQADIAGELYRITRGHLALTRQLVDYLNRSQSAQSLLAHKVFEEFCERILEARVGAAQADAPMLREMLSRAAAIGTSFSKSELECLAGQDAPYLIKCIKAAKELDLFEERGPTIRFLHELFPRILCARNEDERRDLHSRFARCLQKLRPGDYRSRAKHHLDAGELVHAHTLEIHARLADMRAGRVLPLLSEFPDVPRHRGLAAFCSTVENMYELFQAGDYSGAIDLSRSVDATLPRSLLAEADWIVMSAKTRLLSRKERMEAVALGERWSYLAQHEPELWCRLALARVVVLGQMELEPDTRIATEELLDYLSDREGYDTNAELMMNRIKLRADLLYETDVAHYRLQEATRYFGPSESGFAARDPVCYYLALTNLLANQIMLGRYEDACVTAAACKEYIQSVQGTADDVRFPRPDVLANNTALSAYRAGRTSARDAAAAMKAVIAASPVSNDSPLMHSNRVAYSTAAGDPPEPETLEPPFAKLVAGDCEPYFVYFTGNNLAASYLARRDLVRAREIWSRLDNVVPGIDLPIRREMMLRHRRLREMLSSNEPSIEQCEHALRASVEDALGPTWDHHAHVFLLSELQLWIEG